jgi:uncharacterized protein
MENNKRRVLRIYVSSTDRIDHEAVYRLLAFEAKKQGLLGATVYKGVMGYGASSELRSDILWEITEKVPMMVEIIDQKEKIDNFLKIVVPLLDTMPKGCMVTVQDVEVIMTKKGEH